MEKPLREHVSFLETLEEGLYDSGGRLRESLLIERVRGNPRWTFQAGNRAIGSMGISPVELPLPRERNITCVPPKLNSPHSGAV
jgi:hypothetical protein